MKNDWRAGENFKMRFAPCRAAACRQAVAVAMSVARRPGGKRRPYSCCLPRPQIRHTPYDSTMIATNVIAAVVNESSAAFAYAAVTE